MPLDDALDVVQFVTRTDEEERRVLPHALVFGQRDLDLLSAGRVPALAQNRDRIRGLQRLAETLDPFVDLAKEHFVLSDPSLSPLHERRSYRRVVGEYQTPWFMFASVRTRHRWMDSRGLQLLEDARYRIAQSWCRGADARNARGLEVDPWDDEAASWSLLGAMVAVLEEKANLWGEISLDDLAAAMYALSGLIETESLADWNDDPGQTQETVLETLDRAAAAYVEPELLVGLSSN